MKNIKKKFKVFGAALDAIDRPLNIRIKRSYLQRKSQNQINLDKDIIDPYEGFLKFSKVLCKEQFIKIGKFHVDSWVTPKPNAEDYPLITQELYLQFTDSNAIQEYSEKLSHFIEEKVLPDLPLMIGADHSLTGGVLKALSKKYGANNIIVLIFDAHFDAIPAKLSLELAKFMNENRDKLNIIDPYQINEGLDNVEIKNTYTCASYLGYLINEKIILPENLIIFGCQDFPSDQLKKASDIRVKDYINYYLNFEKKGVSFIPAIYNRDIMIRQLEDILLKIDKKYIYISLDVDVSTLKEVLAARFRNVIGIEGKVVISAVQVVQNYLNSNDSKLIGIDIMEIDTYMLNKDLEKSGRSDNTIKLADKVLEILTLNSE